MPVMSQGQIEVESVKDREVDATVEAIAASAKTVYAVEIDNTGNTAASFLKMFDNVGSSLGTTDPVFVFKVPAGRKSAFPMPNDGVGHAFASAVEWACVTTGGTGGTTAPVNTVTATLLTN